MYVQNNLFRFGKGRDVAADGVLELTSFFHGHTQINSCLQSNYENNLKTNRLTLSTTEDTEKETNDGKERQMHGSQDLQPQAGSPQMGG